jgi:hypothetical protein
MMTVLPHPAPSRPDLRKLGRSFDLMLRWFVRSLPGNAAALPLASGRRLVTFFIPINMLPTTGCGRPCVCFVTVTEVTTFGQVGGANGSTEKTSVPITDHRCGDQGDASQ